jgi:DNA-binding NarL/FixJ family response regulator
MTDLTTRQRDVVALVALGFSDKQIGADLELSERRVRVIIARICILAAVDPRRDRRVQLTRWWLGHDAPVLADSEAA